MKKLFLAIFLVTAISAPILFDGVSTDRSVASVDKAPPHGDDGSGGNGGNGGGTIIFDK